ncbi:MAG: Rrf2 family transcriptional regulator [Lachnospiraceae bacterium]|nr:Rrf2 family transcriptional regulator [Lachnospiraceae bacterium]
MILSKKSRYGLRALVDLSVNSKTEHMALNLIAERNGISPQYLEQVFAALRRAGIVKSIKGPQGGYLLGRPAGKITVSEIVLALDGSYFVEDEESPAGSSVNGITETLQKIIIDPVNRNLDEVLRNITLEDLERDYTENGAQDMYYI